MTVAEYIEALKAMPQHAIVLAKHYESGFHEAEPPVLTPAFIRQSPGPYTGLFTCPIIEEMAVDEADLESDWLKQCYNLGVHGRVGKVVVIQ